MTDTVSPISSGPSPELTAQIEAYRVNGLRFINITAFPTDVAAALERQLNSQVDALVAAVAVNPAPIAVPAVAVPFRAPKLTPLVVFYGAETTDSTPASAPTTAPAEVLGKNGRLLIRYGTVSIDTTPNPGLNVVFTTPAGVATKSDVAGDIFVFNQQVYLARPDGTRAARPDDASAPFANVFPSQYAEARAQATKFISS